MFAWVALMQCPQRDPKMRFFPFHTLAKRADRDAWNRSISIDIEDDTVRRAKRLRLPGDLLNGAVDFNYRCGPPLLTLHTCSPIPIQLRTTNNLATTS
jgi:hypothetical protein